MTIAILCGIVLALYILYQIFTSLGDEMRHNPGNVMTGVLVIGVISYIIYRLKKKD